MKYIYNILVLFNELQSMFHNIDYREVFVLILWLTRVQVKLLAIEKLDKIEMLHEFYIGGWGQM
jgi:hypothetical protein